MITRLLWWKLVVVVVAHPRGKILVVLILGLILMMRLLHLVREWLWMLLLLHLRGWVLLLLERLLNHVVLRWSKLRLRLLLLRMGLQ